MNRIVSKLDYEMFNISNFGYLETVNYWLKIRDKQFVLEKAIEVVKDKESEKECFYSPTICFMILKNPRDVDENVHKKLVNAIISNPELSKLSIFGLSFLNLCLADSTLELNDYQINKIIELINDRYYPDEAGLENIIYQKVEISGEPLIHYADAKLEIEISSEDSKTFEANAHFTLVPMKNSEEMRALMEISKRRDFNPRLKQAINNKYDIYLKEMKLLNENDPDIIKLIRGKKIDL